MLGYTQMHHRTGIEELRLAAVESIRETLGDARWEFMTTERDPDVPAVLTTIGNNRYGVPDLILGCGMTDKGLGHLRVSYGDLFAYLEWHKDFTSGEVDLVDYYTFLLKERGHAEVVPIKPSGRIHLLHVDAERWLAGQGWQHAQYYNADERKNARFLQLVLPDDDGRLPWDEGYNYVRQHILESKPFGAKPVAAPVSARAHYLN